MERLDYSLHEQQMVADFQVTRTGEPPSLTDMLLQGCSEHQEVCEVVEHLTSEEIESIKDDPAKARELGMEFVDQIIASFGALSVLNQDFGTLFYQKMSVMLDKYPTGLIKELMQDPFVDRRQAMATAKTIYESRTS